MRYGRSSVAFKLQETGKEWHPAKHKFAGGDIPDRSRERLVQPFGAVRTAIRGWMKCPAYQMVTQHPGGVKEIMGLESSKKNSAKSGGSLSVKFTGPQGPSGPQAESGWESLSPGQ